MHTRHYYLVTPSAYTLASWAFFAIHKNANHIIYAIYGPKESLSNAEQCASQEGTITGPLFIISLISKLGYWVSGVMAVIEFALIIYYEFKQMSKTHSDPSHRPEG